MAGQLAFAEPAVTEVLVPPMPVKDCGVPETLTGSSAASATLAVAVCVAVKLPNKPSASSLTR